jgi:hypothetical protein
MPPSSRFMSKSCTETASGEAAVKVLKMKHVSVASVSVLLHMAEVQG